MTSPNSIENNFEFEKKIDNFLEHFKKTADKAKIEDHIWPNSLLKSKSRMSCFEAFELSDEATEYPDLITNNQSTNYHTNQQQILHQQNSSMSSSGSQNGSANLNKSNTTSNSIQNHGTINPIEKSLNVGDVADLLHPQYAIITGGRSNDGCPLIQFPDNNNFQSLGDHNYQKLIFYLASVPTLQDADSGFNIIVDRRKDRWTSVKSVLLKISAYFPGNIHVVYVLRPAGFFQKAISEVSSKFFRDEFLFRLIICANIEDLHEHISTTQITNDLGGSLIYSHHEWIQQRISLEKFSALTSQVSSNLDLFIRTIYETEFPNSVQSTKNLLNDQGDEYKKLKEEILSAAKHGESLLDDFKTKESHGKEFAERTGNVSSVERLLVQLEETEKCFDEYWNTYFAKLKQCLELRRFEEDFRELQINFDVHIKKVSDMTEIGETVVRVDTLIRETKSFQKICQSDIDRALDVVSTGQQLLNSRDACPNELVQPKCDELSRVCDILTERIIKRLETLSKNHDLMERVDKANRWCAQGVELLASQRIEKCSSSTEFAEQSLSEILEFIASAAEFKLSSPKEFKDNIQDSTTPETKAFVTQVLQRIEDVSLMCDKRVACLKKLTLKPPRPVQSVNPEPAVPIQPFGGAPHPFRARKIHTRIESIDTRPRSIEGLPDSRNHQHEDTTANVDIENILSQSDLESIRLKRGHVLAELFETERLYVVELGSILKGYRDQMESEELAPLVPPGLQGKEDILFGNLYELYTFHSEVFLKDLENCISTTELVALCFVQRRDTFYRLYSYYCQNIPRSERLRETLVDTHLFLQECQKRLGHKLPLAAYLLKPVQRITKYQLLLKDLLKFSDSGTCGKELQKALDCMLIVLKCVNDSMHQIAITGFPADLSQQGELLMQDSFQIWTDSKKDLRLRVKAQQRHIFLYQKVLIFCKPASKTGHNKSTYQFKHSVKMSEIGLTESVRGDPKRFEVWLQGRHEVHTIQATNIDIKNKWVAQIKEVLLNQLKELKVIKDEVFKQIGLNHKPLRHTTSYDIPQSTTMSTTHRTLSCDTNSECSTNRNSIIIEDVSLTTGLSSLSSEPDNKETGTYSSDYSNSEDEYNGADDAFTPGNKFISLADYCGMGHSEATMKEGDHVELLKIGCAGWWFVKVIGNNLEGWAPAAYLESINE